MSHQAILVLSCIGLSMLISAAVATYSWSRRSVRCARILAMIAAAQALITLGYAGELISTRLDTMILLDWAQWLPAIAAAFGCLVFARTYVDAAPLGRWTRLNVTAAAVAAVLLVLSAPLHGALYSSPSVDRTGLFVELTYELTPLFWLLTVLISVPMLWAIGLLVRQLSRSPGHFRGQLLTIIGGLSLPLVGVQLWLLWDPYPAVPRDSSPLFFGAGNLMMAWAVFRFRFFDFLPIAHKVMMNGMTEGVLVVDRSRRVVDSNPAMAAIATASGVELHQGGRLDELTAQHESWRAAFGDDEGGVREVPVQTPEGRHIYAVRPSTLTDRRGAELGKLFLVLDVSERRRAIEERERYTRDLEQRNRALDAFSRMVAHDLKSPLGVLSGVHGLISSSLEPDDDDIGKELDLCSDALEQMTETIDSLLLLASTRQLEDVPRERLAMGLLVTRSRHRLSKEIETRQAEVRIADDWPDTVGHAPWIETVWINFLSNGLKYGGTPPRLELGADPKKDGFVRHWIRDSGPGLEPQQAALVFDEGVRLDRGRCRGHGLGLAIVRRIVTRLGGETGVVSQPGQGCEFWFSLPVPERPSSPA